MSMSSLQFTSIPFLLIFTLYCVKCQNITRFPRGTMENSRKPPLKAFYEKVLRKMDAVNSIVLRILTVRQENQGF